jgi:hypothetical protein
VGEQNPTLGCWWNQWEEVSETEPTELAYWMWFVKEKEGFDFRVPLLGVGEVGGL